MRESIVDVFVYPCVAHDALLFAGKMLIAADTAWLEDDFDTARFAYEIAGATFLPFFAEEEGFPQAFAEAQASDKGPVVTEVVPLLRPELARKFLRGLDEELMKLAGRCLDAYQSMEFAEYSTYLIDSARRLCKDLLSAYTKALAPQGRIAEVLNLLAECESLEGNDDDAAAYQARVLSLGRRKSSSELSWQQGRLTDAHAPVKLYCRVKTTD